MKYLFIAALIALHSPQLLANTKKVTCLSSREFITTLEYLRHQKDFALTEEASRDLANKVSEGCSGASKRFIQVTDLLVKAGFPSAKSVETGLKFAREDDQSTGAFLTVFKGSFVSELLDLDAHHALKLALDLSQSFSGNRKNAVKEFNKLVKFCVDKKSLDLPMLECGKMSARVIKAAEAFVFKTGETFIEMYRYLTDRDMANLATPKALELAEFIVKHGPEAKNNFIGSFEYALSQKGLGLNQTEAINFAKSMTSKSYREEAL